MTSKPLSRTRKYQLSTIYTHVEMDIVGLVTAILPLRHYIYWHYPWGEQYDDRTREQKAGLSQIACYRYWLQSSMARDCCRGGLEPGPRLTFRTDPN